MTYTLRAPNAPATATGDTFAVHYTPAGPDYVDVVNHCKGGIGARLTVEAARAHYRQLLTWGYKAA